MFICLLYVHRIFKGIPVVNEEKRQSEYNRPVVHDNRKKVVNNSRNYGSARNENMHSKKYDNVHPNGRGYRRGKFVATL